MSAAVQPGSPPHVGTPIRLFTLPQGVGGKWGVSRDGSKVLLATPQAPPLPTMAIILNWSASAAQ